MEIVQLIRRVVYFRKNKKTENEETDTVDDQPEKEKSSMHQIMNDINSLEEAS